MLLATFSKDLIPALNTTFWYRWMISYMCGVSFKMCIRDRYYPSPC